MLAGKFAVDYTRRPSDNGGYRYPFTPYPKGWFALAWQQELAPGGILREHAFGRDLVAFRTAAGDCAVVDATCPHLGANLGLGTVVDDSLRCPFHGWRFGADGHCVETPFADSPVACAVKSWPVRVVDGMIIVWHDPADRPPAWEVTPLHDPAWTEPTLFEDCNWVFRSHVQEIAENGIDIMHLAALHGFSGQPAASDLRVDGPRAHWRIRAEVDTGGLGLPGKTREEVRPVLQGLGLQQVTIDTGDAGLGFRACIYATPVNEELIHVRVPLSVSGRGSRADRQHMLERWRDAFVRDFERDIAIWETKEYHERPLFSPSDGPIAKLRHWAVQFY